METDGFLKNAALVIFFVSLSTFFFQNEGNSREPRPQDPAPFFE
jgi:hypothetical protein